MATPKIESVTHRSYGWMATINLIPGVRFYRPSPQACRCDKCGKSSSANRTVYEGTHEPMKDSPEPWCHFCDQCLDEAADQALRNPRVDHRMFRMPSSYRARA